MASTIGIAASDFGLGASTATSATPVPTKSLGQEDYLKLMAEELKNQDPLEPMDNKDFLAQMAQFSSLEQMNNIAGIVGDMQINMSGLYQQSLLTQGAALIGKQVTGADENGDSVQGTVDSVKVMNGTVQLSIGDKIIDISSVSEIAPENGL